MVRHTLDHHNLRLRSIHILSVSMEEFVFPILIIFQMYKCLGYWRRDFPEVYSYIIFEQAKSFLFLEQGHRAYAGHKKHVTPNKRQMLPYFLNTSLPEPEFNRIIMDLHRDSLGQPELRTSKVGRDVTKYPIPECMCNSSTPQSSL